MNNPLHSLIYSVAHYYDKVHVTTTAQEIKTELSIIGSSASEEITNLIESKLETRRKRLECLLTETIELQKSFKEIMNLEPKLDTPTVEITRDQAYVQGYESKPDDTNPYQHKSKLLWEAWKKGKAEFNTNEGVNRVEELRDKYYDEGFKAFFMTNNPYMPGTFENKNWAHGYDDGHEED